MGIFNINATDHGKVFIVRPLLNAKNLKENIVSYKNDFSSYKWKYRYMCFALINDELKIFNFSEQIYKIIVSDGISNMLMDSNKAIKITVNVKNGFLDNNYEIIEDDKYRFDNTIEKQTYIENLLTTTELDLSEELKQVKSKIGYREIKFPNGSVKKLQEIYESEDLI